MDDWRYWREKYTLLKMYTDHVISKTTYERLMFQLDSLQDHEQTLEDELNANA